MWAKRGMDLVIAIAVLLVTSPLLIAAATAIKLTSPGPVLFRQRRIGQRGRQFTVFKLRSMSAGADPTSLAQGGDSRITPVGRWLRKTALDEVPQLINVLLGDMSILGPRPALPEMVPYYTREEARRLWAKPGLTGWAQVGGRNSLPYHGRLRLNLWYVDHRSLWLDIRILAKTVLALPSADDLYQDEPRPWERRPTADK